MVSDTFEKINLGVGEMTEFLKNKNKELDEKIKEKRENVKRWITLGSLAWESRRSHFTFIIP